MIFFPWLPHPTPGLVFWKPCWCYIYYTTVHRRQSPLWISTILKAPFKSTCFLHYAKKKKTPPSFVQSDICFKTEERVVARDVSFTSLIPTWAYCTACHHPSQDMTLYIGVLIMQTFLRGTEPHCRLKLSHWLTWNLSEPSQKKQFSGQELVLLILTGGLNVAGDPLQSFIAANTWESARCPHTWNVYREQSLSNKSASILTKW